MRRRQKQGQKTLPKTETPVIVMPEATDSAEFCPPSSPFMDDDPVEEMSLEDLRAALLPPPSLFTPPASKPAPELPESSLLKSAPVYVEIEEDLPSTSASANINSVLPDTIVIPITQETAPDLWSNSPSSESDQNGSPASVPQGGSKAPPATPISKEPAEIPVSRPAMQPPLPAKKERGFLAWLRKP
ncbi:hypothetical protein [Prosthecobacter sp. SYSU 5D2]|uniref:hypothetical protein n=1 Tax=Prosthecobacter sp. SYSU 5D2 TaxID=3134134 RepID=UPI0031FE8D1A